MEELITIELRQLRFFAFHGLYPEEKKTGNEFEIDLTVAFIPVSGTITGLDDTINYVALYETLRAEMQKPRDLLETFAMEMTDIIHRSFAQAKKIRISITKLHLLIPAFTGNATVSYQREFR
jgi:dihydroneopterin aldolase